MKQTKENKTVTFFYDKSMLPYFEEGRKQFTRQTMISLDGISWEVLGEQLVVKIETEQQEKYLFHLAFSIGTCYAKMKQPA